MENQLCSEVSEHTNKIRGKTVQLNGRLATEPAPSTESGFVYANADVKRMRVRTVVVASARRSFRNWSVLCLLFKWRNMFVDFHDQLSLSG